MSLSVSFGLLDVPHVAHPAILVFGSYCTYLLGTYGFDPIVAGIVLMPPFFLLGMGSMAVAAGAMWWWFRHKGWTRSDG